MAMTAKEKKDKAAERKKLAKQKRAAAKREYNRLWTEPLEVEDLDLTKTIRCICFDPGTDNFACSVVEAKKTDKLRYRILGTRMLEHTIKEPKAYVRRQSRGFEKELRKLIKDYGPFDLCIAERFQPRGYGGNTIESVNMMLGVMQILFQNSDTRFITAALWKNAFNRIEGLDLKECYDVIKAYEKASGSKHTIHEFDSTLMGMFRLAQVFGVTPFDLFEHASIDKYIQRFDQSKKL